MDEHPDQLRMHDEFQGRIRQTPSGRYSLSNLTLFDLQRIKSALGMDLTNANVAAHQPAPHWWNDGRASGDHAVWFSDWARYYREAVETFDSYGVR